MDVTSFDHVALWTAERDELARLLTDGCGMHVIDRTDAFTLVGGDARRGKVTLFAAEAPRERGVLERIVVRVPDLESARERLTAAGYPPDGAYGLEPAPRADGCHAVRTRSPRRTLTAANRGISDE